MRLVEQDRGRHGGVERGRPGRHADPRVAPLDHLRRQPRTLRPDHHNDPTPKHGGRRLSPLRARRPPRASRPRRPTRAPAAPWQAPPPRGAPPAAIGEPASAALLTNPTVASSLAAGAWKMEPMVAL